MTGRRVTRARHGLHVDFKTKTQPLVLCYGEWRPIRRTRGDARVFCGGCGADITNRLKPLRAK